MSVMSVLSHEYTTASDLSRDLNAALIVLKKARWGLPGADTIASEKVKHSRWRLSKVLTALGPLLKPAKTGRSLPAQDTHLRVPGALVTRLRSERRGDLESYLEDLEGIAARLQVGLEAVTDADLGLLDHLAEAADAETSSVYRQLMRT